MVRGLELIFNKDPGVVARVPAQDVCPKRANVLFLSLKLEVGGDCVPQQLEVLRLGEPRGEALGLAFLHLPKINTFKASEIGWRHTALPSCLAGLLIGRVLAPASSNS